MARSATEGRTLADGTRNGQQLDGGFRSNRLEILADLLMEVQVSRREAIQDFGPPFSVAVALQGTLECRIGYESV